MLVILYPPARGSDRPWNAAVFSSFSPCHVEVTDGECPIGMGMGRARRRLGINAERGGRGGGRGRDHFHVNARQTDLGGIPRRRRRVLHKDEASKFLRLNCTSSLFLRAGTGPLGPERKGNRRQCQRNLNLSPGLWSQSRTIHIHGVPYVPRRPPAAVAAAASQIVLRKRHVMHC